MAGNQVVSTSRTGRVDLRAQLVGDDVVTGFRCQLVRICRAAQVEHHGGVVHVRHLGVGKVERSGDTGRDQARPYGRLRLVAHLHVGDEGQVRQELSQAERLLVQRGKLSTREVVAAS